MKKNPNYRYNAWFRSRMYKLLNIMRITVFLMLISMFQVVANSSYSQNTRLNLELENATLEEVFEEIKGNSEFTIFYKNDQVDLDRRVDLKMKDATVDNILDETLDGTELTYRVIDKHIIVYPDEEKAIQDGTEIKGKVTEKNGEPVPGVTVLVKGTTIGAVTDMDGMYTITVPAEANTLTFSFVGKRKQEITINGRDTINVRMEDDMIGLDEVVAIGYGVQKKSDLTGAVASVKSETLNKMAVSNPAETLQGRIAGVNVTTIGGAPGAGVDVKIRGVGTINHNSPLYVIDGVPGSFYMINPEDISTLEVLKDGAAAAIYGTEAANGVVLITTKKGEQGAVKVAFHAKYGIQKLVNSLEMTNSEEYVKVATMMYQNAGLDLPEYLSMPVYYDTEWLDAVSRVAPQQEYNVNISGGNEMVNYYISAGWLDQTGTMIDSEFSKASLRSNIDFDGDWLKGGLKISYNETESQSIPYSIRETYHILPMIPVFDDSQPSGYGMADSNTGMLSNNNPVGVAYYNDNSNTDQYVSVNTYFTFDLFDGLTYRFEGGLNNSNRHYHSHHPSYNVNSKEEVLYPGVYEERTNWKEWNLNNILTYNKEIEDHRITAMAAYTTQKETSDYVGAGISGYKNIYDVEEGSLVVSEQPTGFLDEWFNTLNAGQDGESSVSGSRWTYTRASILGRINYSYKNRYLLQLSVRRDGSSKFGSESRYGTFPSAAIGWRISEESFVQDLDVFSNLKLRGSYAKLGNERSLGRYDFLPTITSSTKEFLSYSKGNGESVWLGSIARDLENKNLQWETTYTANVGIDFGFMRGKLNGSVNYYNNRTEDMLVVVPIPSSSGMNSPIVNFGEVQNSGLEFELGYNGKKGDFSYNINATLSTTKNEVLMLGSEEASIKGQALNFTEHYPNQTRKGYPIGAFFLYQADGIFQNQAEVDAHNANGADGEPLQANAAPGDIRFRDVNSDGELDDEDMIFSGTGIPKYNFSVSFDAAYKGFDFSLLLYGAGGHKIYNANRYYFESMRTPRNFFSTTANAWTAENPTTDMPRAIFGDPNQNSRPSTRFLEDGDFLRLKNVQVGYTLPSELVSKVKLSRVRVYVSGQNLLTFTGYSGQDPEVGRSSVFNPSLDRTLYPISSLYLVGVQVAF